MRFLSALQIMFIVGSLFVGAGAAGRAAEFRPCGDDRIVMKEGSLRLDRNERVLVCGSEKGFEGWREVPLSQAQYQIRVLLQNKGYLQPRFERDRDKLYVWSGARTEASAFEIRGADGVLNAGKKRQVVGEPITPEKLDEIRNWIELELRARGFACPEAHVTAQAWDGRVIADVATARERGWREWSAWARTAWPTAAFARYQAFEAGDIYDVRETQITAGRMLADGLFQSAHFSEKCRDGLVDLRLLTSVGKPHVLRFELGASTEEFPFSRIWLRDSRLDDRASSFTSILYGSPRVQSLELNARLYRLPWSRRSYLGPRLVVARKFEAGLYEENSARLGADLGRSWDAFKWRWQTRFGPTLNYLKTVQGIGPEDIGYFSWEGHLEATSHPTNSLSRIT
ncbi:MAG: hypothetical protein HC902_02195 [Calothrix sp. SM1_5_4]|nr:hypothetical protein [Calothrix sp. SM1_5_4]